MTLLVGMGLVAWGSVLFAGIMLWVASWQIAGLVGAAARGEKPPLVPHLHSLSLTWRIVIIFVCHVIALGLAIAGYLLSTRYFLIPFNPVNFATLWSCSMGMVFSFPALLLQSSS